MPDSEESVPPTGGGQPATGLAMPAGTASTQAPFWHRPDPVVAVTRLDAGYRRLKEAFPASWQPLLDVKVLLDAVASMQLSGAGKPSVRHDAAGQLLLTAAEKLTQAGTAEEAQRPAAAGLALDAASRLRAFARTGEWPVVTLTEPSQGEPWLYCGPLGTWAFRTCEAPISLMVTGPRPDMQTGPDRIDASLSEVWTAVAQALGGPVSLATPVRPTMHAMDLLLAGGELASGHKHFAHFFPLESPRTAVAGPEFTVVFANIHQHRLQRCSLELLAWYMNEAYKPCSLQEITLTSLSWFRAHDLGHSWRLADSPADCVPDALTDLECMTLEECYADVLGLISSAAVLSPVAVSQAFTAELLRYLSRDHSRFGDSAAAALTIGWLIGNGVTLPPGSAEWLAEALPGLGALARTIDQVRWESRREELPRLRAALRTGREFCAGLNAIFQSVPTDLDYSFG